MIGSATSHSPSSSKNILRLIAALICLLFVSSSLSAQVVIEVIDIPGKPVSTKPILHGDEDSNHLRILNPDLTFAREGDQFTLQSSLPTQAVEIMDLQGRRLAYEAYKEGATVRFQATEMPNQIAIVRALTSQGWMSTKVKL